MPVVEGDEIVVGIGGFAERNCARICGVGHDLVKMNENSGTHARTPHYEPLHNHEVCLL